MAEMPTKGYSKSIGLWLYSGWSMVGGVYNIISSIYDCNIIFLWFITAYIARPESYNISY